MNVHASYLGNSRREQIWLWSAVLAMLSLFLIPLHSQVDQGTIAGTVTDSTGAVVPNAAVTVTNVDTGFTQSGKTDSRGIYTFSPLKIR